MDPNLKVRMTSKPCIKYGKMTIPYLMGSGAAEFKKCINSPW